MSLKTTIYSVDQRNQLVLRIFLTENEVCTSGRHGGGKRLVWNRSDYRLTAAAQRVDLDQDSHG